MRSRLILLPASALMVLCACVPNSGDGGAASAGAHEDGIAWFEGDADAAFEAARRDNKPLFLYWGAEWCPPCQHLKTTTFRRPEFVEKTRRFIPVYLDGDSERAQILGEKLGVESYPTVLVFSPGGEEIMRMPRDVDAEQYVSLLDAALAKMRPIREVLNDVMRTGPAGARPGDLSLLAFYSWGRDEDVGLEKEEAYEIARRLYEETPVDRAVEKSRFLTHFLGRAVDRAHSAGEGGAIETIPDEDRARYREALLELLEDGELSRSNLPFVLHAGPDTVRFFHEEPSPGRDALLARWDDTARRIERDEAMSIVDRLGAAVTRVRLFDLGNGETADEGADRPRELPPEMVEHVRERVTWAAESVTDDSEMQSVMNTMARLLEEAGLSGEAETLLKERMDDARAPYYFMSWVANIKKNADQAEEAVVWYRKAYDSSRGRYTRFRWGSIYLRQIMALRPEDRESIEEDSMEILGELLSLEDAFAGGNYMRLGQLDTAYREWNESGEHDELVDRIRVFVHERCNDYPGGDEDSQRARCRSFLTGSATNAEAS